MSARKRTVSLNLPPNLYAKHDRRTGKIYYQYKNPLDGRWYSMGTDEASAINDAVAINHQIYAAMRERARAQIIRPDCPTLHEFWPQYEQSLKDRRLKPNTLRSRKSQFNQLARAIGNTPLNEITVRDIVAILDEQITLGQRRNAQALRACAIDIFKEAIHRGLVEDNPAAKTRNPTAEVKRRRLTLEEAQLLLSHARGWLKNAILLALITGQRVGDISNMRFADFDGEWLHVEQEKNKTSTPKRYRYHKDLRLDAIGMTLGEVIALCRKDGIISRYLIHHQRNSTLARRGDPVHRQTISKAFTRLVRQHLKGDNLPTFHELRSLSARLYHEQGADSQKVLGHKDRKTTERYIDNRGVEWISVS